MPVYDPRDYEDQMPAPPNTPPAGGGGGAPAPAGGGGATWSSWGQGPSAPSGGGGGGGAPLVRPGYTGANIPGAPRYDVNPFVAPDRNSLLSDPGYLSRLDTGVHALDASAAAKGSLRTGGHGMALEQYGQNLGSQEYGAAYNRGLSSYDRYVQNQKDMFAPKFAQWQQNADAQKQASLMGYGADLSHWGQASAPHYEPAFDPTILLDGDFGGGGSGYGPIAPPPTQAPGYDDPRRPSQYDY